MKRKTVLLPLCLPCLSDAAAAQLLACLEELFEAIEHHYGEQAHRYRRRTQARTPPRLERASNPEDPPF